MKFPIFYLMTILTLKQATGNISIICEFENYETASYACNSKGWQVTSIDNRTIMNVTGIHLKGKSNNDVKYFKSDGNLVKYFPIGLTVIFKNLETVEISNSSLIEVNNSDLQQFGTNLKTFWTLHNMLEVLDADLFKFNPNLERISFFDNRLRHVENGIFTNLKNLWRLRFDNNLCVSDFAVNKTAIMKLVYEVEKKCKDVTIIMRKYHEASMTKLDKISAKIVEIDAKCVKEVPKN